MKDERYNPVDDGTRTEGDQVGFTRHRSSNARRSAAPAASVQQRVAEARENREDRGASARAERPAADGQPTPRRGRPSEGNDYPGTGEPCRVCGNLVGAEQPRCPHCGAFVRPLQKTPAFWVAVAALVVIVVLLTLAVGSCRSEGTVDGDDRPTQSSVSTTGQVAVSTDGSTSGADKSSLQYALTNAQFALDSAASSHSATYASQSALQDAIDEANAVYADAAATSEQIAAASQSVTDAMNGGLVPVATSYDQPLYDALLNEYMGGQAKINGTILGIERADGGTATIVVGKDGYDTYPVVVRCYDTLLADDCVVGMEIDVYGVVTGTQDNADAQSNPEIQAVNPVMFADSLAYAWEL